MYAQYTNGNKIKHFFSPLYFENIILNRKFVDSD